MNLQVNDYNEALSKWCRTIIKCHNDLSVLIDKFSFHQIKEYRPIIDRNLIKMTLSAQKIIDLVFPIPSTGEIHGLPKEMSSLGDEPDIIVYDREHPKWDFKPWFAEKASALKEAINDLINYLEMDSDTIEAFPSTADSYEEHVGQMVRSNMAEIDNKANAILDMIESGRLVIKDVKLEEWEE